MDDKKTPTQERIAHMGRVQFFAKLPQVKEKVAQGYAVSVIYREYKSALSISYSQFRRYVTQYVQPAKLRSMQQGPINASPAPLATHAASRPASAPRRFEYDPAQALKARDELI